MNEMMLCNQALSPTTLQNQCGIDVEQLSAFNCAKPTMVAVHTPYLIGGNDFGFNRSVLSQLSPMLVARELTNLSLSYGGDNVVALAEITTKLENYNIGLMGTSTAVYANRIGGFAGSVKDYQAALMEYRRAITSNSALKALFKEKAHTAFERMQSQFQNELNLVVGQVKARRGMPLTNAKRATNIARSSRNVAKLNITSHVQTSNLVKLSKQAKFLGNGLAVIEFGSRVGNIHNSYQAGGNWERDLFIESSSFVASAGAGILAVKSGIGALSLLMVATPVGWVGLIIGGIAVAGVAVAASIGMNNVVKEKSGELYDDIMKWALM
ncbi:MAG: hypothetical protein GY799_27420 [Desulfobulbaceae bacterium]|nr:hypothetical protein [Desulfobulbaceae bacterium]